MTRPKLAILIFSVVIVLAASLSAFQAVAQVPSQTLALKQGFNFVSFTIRPVISTGGLMAAPNFRYYSPANDLISQNSSIIEEIYMYSASSGSFLTAGEGLISTLAPGRGYIIKTKAAGTVNLTGSLLGTVGTVNLKAGFNLAGFSKMPETLTFSQLMGRSNLVRGIYKWSAASGTFIQVLRGASGAAEMPDGIDPTLRAGECYFVDMDGDTTLDMDGAGISIGGSATTVQPGTKTIASLTLVPASIELETGKALDLGTIAATASYGDGTSEAAKPAWSLEGQGSLAGAVYTAPAAPAAVKLTATLVQGGKTVTATLTVNVITPAGPALPAGAPEMVTVSGGTFTQGAVSAAQRRVTLDNFQISKFEVTNTQILPFLNAMLAAGKIASDGKAAGKPWFNNYKNVSVHPASGYDHSVIADLYFANGQFNIIPGYENHPMVSATWYCAAAYCNWLSEKYGLEKCYNETSWECDFSKNGFRMPTSAEWEFAARGGNQSMGYLYAGGNDLNAVSWNSENCEGHCQIVGKKLPNELGLYDMTGNPCEWCNDWSETIGTDAVTNPRGPATGTAKVLRGGRMVGGHSMDNGTPSSGPPDNDMNWTGIRLGRGSKARATLLTVSRDSIDIQAGTTFDLNTLAVQAYFSDGAIQTVKPFWRASSGAVNQGVFTAPPTLGDIPVTAEYSEGGTLLAATVKFRVVAEIPKTLTSLALSVTAAECFKGSKYDLSKVTATATYADTRTEKVTPVWSAVAGSVSGLEYSTFTFTTGTIDTLTASYTVNGVTKTATLKMTLLAPPKINFSLALAKGMSWTYTWTMNYSMYTARINNKSSDTGEFTVTLGEPSFVEGVGVFPVTVTGKTISTNSNDNTFNYKPEWSYLAVNRGQLLGSSYKPAKLSDMKVVFNGVAGWWTGGGYFKAWGATDNILAKSGYVSNIAVTGSVYQTGVSKDDPNTFDYGGTIYQTSNSSSKFSEYEYFSTTMGPVEYAYNNYYSWNSYSDAGAITTTRKLSLKSFGDGAATASNALSGLSLSRTADAISMGTPYKMDSLFATALYANGSTKSVTPVFTVTSGTLNGNLYYPPAAEGDYPITASYEEGGTAKTATCVLTVKAPGYRTLSKIEVVQQPPKAVLLPDKDYNIRQLASVKATYSDGTAADITSQAVWSDYYMVGDTLHTSKYNRFEEYATPKYSEGGITCSAKFVYAISSDPSKFYLSSITLYPQSAKIQVGSALYATMKAGSTVDLESSDERIFINASFADGNSKLGFSKSENVVWTVSGGTVNGWTYTAPSTPGLVTFTATCTYEGVTKSGSVNIQIVQ